MIIFDKNLIVNAENTDELEKSRNFSNAMLTCGLSLKSTVTASSIDDNGFVYCIQRGFFRHDGKLVLPQEFNVSWTSKAENIYPYLEAVTLLILSGIPPKEISDNLYFDNK
ncbi:MAG: hypothetical protein MRZ66_00385 [Clostridiales bacterium]|nr:hypothetical protein [Clostridiales bacterium]